MKRATIDKIEIKKIIDEDADLSYLDQHKDSTDPEFQKYYQQDQQRKGNYGNSWYMLGIKAVATIKIPFEVTTGNGQQTNYKIQEIDTGGLWGTESDSDKAHFLEVAAEELNQLENYLHTLNVDTSNFVELSKIAVEAIL